MSGFSLPKLATGVSGLDDILNGGLQAGRAYLVEGAPGTGKTTIALQFLLAGQEAGDHGLYITLSESAAELTAVAASHGWTLDGLHLFEMITEEGLDPEQDQTVLHPADLELGETLRTIMAEVEAHRPQRVVFDSLSELRLLAQSPLRYRRQVLALKQFFSQRQITVLMLDDRSGPTLDLQLHSIAHGVVLLEQILLDFGSERRRLRVLKLRGTAYRGGWHDYVIQRGGVVAFPRLVASEHGVPFDAAIVSSGTPGLDALLGGGLMPGTNILLTGPSGTGKTATATSTVLAALRRGQKAAFFLFDEGIPTLLVRSAQLGMDLRPSIESGQLLLRQIDPAQLSPGEFAALVKSSVEQDGAGVVVIDSLNAYLQSMPGEQYLLLQMHELLSFLNLSGVLTVMILAQHGIVGPSHKVIDISYLADTVVLLRFFEVSGAIRKAISVVKTRTMANEPTIRELALDANGLTVGPPLKGFRGVLTGVPEWDGPQDDLLPIPGLDGRAR